MSDTIRQWIESTYINETKMRERQIRLALQPRPRWLPDWAWKRIIARLLIVEEQDVAGSSQP